MTYFLEDDGGKFLGDLASGMGLRDMREQKELPKLAQFIGQGQVTEGEVASLLSEVDGHPAFNYVAEALKSTDDFPVVITDGVGPSEK